MRAGALKARYSTSAEVGSGFGRKQVGAHKSVQAVRC
jgi:hypothetical protein